MEKRPRLPASSLSVNKFVDAAQVLRHESPVKLLTKSGGEGGGGGERETGFALGA